MTNQRLHLVGLGCARNDVDSEELAARFDQAGFDLVDRPDQAEVIVVNTCGFIAAAKQDSIDQILAAADWKQSGPAQAVIATGCLAERYGAELAAALPEADAVVGFDGYADIAATVTAVLEGRPAPSHQPRDRRLLPLIAPSPSAHTGSTTSPAGPGTVAAASKSATANTTVTVDSAATPLATATLAPEPTRSPLRRRLETGPSAALKIASGCDRRCAFCAIPQFRGRFQSRPADDIVAEARWLAEQGVRELVLVSENSTAYGKDLGTQPTGERSAALTSLLSRLSQVDGIDWLRLLYLQPAELTPALIAAVATTPKVVPYIDLPVQHASPRLLRRMRRFGGGDRFLTLLDQIRQARPEMAIRTNVIV
ncbi:MAG: radical SAM protein, partial [Propionibacteriaceae bacterium]|nr:radical SAM protein [Propionibacteriaceae bacterium]